MPRGDNLTPGQKLIKALILGDPKVGKTDWALRAAIAGFNVLYMDGDVAAQTIAQLPDEAKKRIYYMDVADDLVGDTFDPKMIHFMADFVTSPKMLWNDSKQRVLSRNQDKPNEEGFVDDEVWEIRPAKFDHNWVWVWDSWTTLSYSAMLDKAIDLGVNLADMEKVEMNLYAGVGNRLTNLLHTIQKAPCHVIVIGHPSQYEKSKSPDNKTAREVKMVDRVVEWTKMVPKSSSNPHGLTMGKYFTDIGWIDVDKWGKRKLDFTITSNRTSGGHLDSKGDPRDSHTFGKLVESIGGVLPDKNSSDLGEGLIIHEPGTYIPAVAKVPKALGKTATPASESSAPTQVKGLGGLASLKKV